jgi:inner membrane protein
MMNLFITYWHWLGLAATLFIIEVLTGTGFLLWLGLSALLVVFLLFIYPLMAMTTQLFIFALFSIITALGWKLYLSFYPIRTDRPRLNKRAEQYVGQAFTLETPIINGKGIVRVGDSIWQVKCHENLAAGSSIRIIDAEGVILVAKKLD